MGLFVSSSEAGVEKFCYTHNVFSSYMNAAFTGQNSAEHQITKSLPLVNSDSSHDTKG